MPAPSPAPFSLLIKRLAVLAAAASLGACISPPPILTPAAPLIHTVEQADRTLAAAAAERAVFDAEFANSERVCNQRFFVNSCLDAAKEKRRVALAHVRAAEVEANRFKRQADVDERDRALVAAEKEEQAREAAAAAQPAVTPSEATPVAAPAPVAQGASRPVPSRAAAKPVNRAALHAAKLKRLADEEAAGASKRAENVAAFEAKRVESEQRQRDVAARKAEKAAKAAKSGKDASVKAEPPAK